nr:MAG: RNA-dependent RNA polymerase [Wufeng shrew picorna-like virus 5]WPV63507.1 MAG: RNA-dependent RNA polymerase [Wufeng shrew picorna-like virus 5]
MSYAMYTDVFSKSPEKTQKKILSSFALRVLPQFSQKDRETILACPHQLRQVQSQFWTVWTATVDFFTFKKSPQPLFYEIGWKHGLKRCAFRRHVRRAPQKKRVRFVRSTPAAIQELEWDEHPTCTEIAEDLEWWQFSHHEENREVFPISWDSVVPIYPVRTDALVAPFEPLESDFVEQAILPTVQESVFNFGVWSQNFFNGMGDQLTFKDIEQLLDVVKPINLVDRIKSMANVPFSQRSAHIFALMELYGFFWNDYITGQKPILLKIAPLVCSLIAPFVASFVTPDSKFEPPLVEQAFEKKELDPEHVPLVTQFLKLFGIEDGTIHDIITNYGYVIGCVLLGLLLLLGTLGFAVDLKGTVFGNFVKSIQKIGSFVKATTTISVFLGMVTPVFFSFLSSFFGYEYIPEADKTVYEFKVKLLEFKKKLNDYKIKIETDLPSIVADPSELQKIADFLKEQDAMFAELIKINANLSNIKPLMDEVRNLAKEIQSFVTEWIKAQSTKLEPCVIWLAGAPGIGKSKMVELITRKLDALHGSPGTCYIRNPGDKFYSGYVNQRYFIFDDFGMARDCADHTELIQLKSPAGTRLNMAELESKGRTFSSPYIIICSNMTDILRSETANTLGALNRRRDFLYIVTDPWMDAFKDANAGHPPVDIMHPRIDRGNGEEHYYQPEFSHLNIQRRVVEAARENDHPRETVSVNQIATNAYNKHLNFYQTYLKTIEAKIAPTVGQMAPAVQDPTQIASTHGPETASVVSSLADQMEAAIDMWQNEMGGMMEDQAIENESSAIAFTGFTHETCRMICFEGDPGTGKSWAARAICRARREISTIIHVTELQHLVHSSPILYVEDVTCSAEAFERFRVFMMHLYDNPGHLGVQILLFTMNGDLVPTYVPDPQMHYAFERRFSSYLFSYRPIPNVGVFSYFQQQQYFTAAMVENPPNNYTIGQMVKITFTSEEETLEVTLPSLLKKFITAEIAPEVPEKPLCVRVPYIGRNLIDPEIIIQIQGNLHDFAHLLIAEPRSIVKSYFTGGVKLVKGSYARCMSIFNGFNVSGPPVVDLPVDIDDLIVHVNNLFSSTTVPFSSLVILDNVTLFFAPVNDSGKNLNLFKVCDQMEVDTVNGTISVGNDTSEMNNTTKQLYTNLLGHLGEISARTVALENSVSLALSCPRLAATLSLISYVVKFTTTFFTIQSLWMQRTLEFHCQDFARAFMEDRAPLKESRGEEKRDYKSRVYGVPRELYEGPFGDPSKNLYGEVEHGSLDWSRLEAKKQKLQKESEHAKDLSYLPQPIINVNPYLYWEEGKMPKWAPRETIEQDIKNESLIDSEAADVVDLCVRNTGYLLVNGEHACRALMIHKRYGVSVAHPIPKEGVVNLEFIPLKGNPSKFKCEIVKVARPNDLCIFKLPIQAPEFKSLIGWMPTLSSKSFDGLLATLVVADRDKMGDITKTYHNTRVLNLVETELAGQKRYGLKYAGTLNGYAMPGPLHTTYGHCGSPVIVMNTAVKSKLVSIHNSSNATKGFGSVLFGDKIMEIISDFEMVPESIPVPKPEALPKQEVIIYDSPSQQLLGMPIVGKCDKPVMVNEKSKLWKSPFHLGTSNYEPSILSAKDPRYNGSIPPFFESVKKWNHPQPDIDLPLLDIVVEETARHFAQTVKLSGRIPHVITKKQAINKVVSFESSNPLYRQSSSGYPWSFYSKNKDKYLESVDNGKGDLIWTIKHDEHGQRLHHGIDDIICCARKGRRPASVFVSSLKDEALKLKKIEKYDTRAFAGAPLDYTIAHRMYFHTAFAAIQENRHRLPPQVGMNPTSEDWQIMYYDLVSNSSVGFDADYKKFDATIPLEFMKRVPIVYNRIFQVCDPKWKAEDDIIRTHIHSALWGPLLVVPCNGQSYIVQAPGGQVSGQPGTSMDNSIVNCFFFFYAWLKIMLKHNRKMATFQAFLKNVVFKVYGDDNLCSIKLNALPFFNLRTFANEMKEIGMEVTDAAKTGNLRDYFPVSEMEFLKRSFRKVDNKILGPLLLPTFDKMLGYVMLKRSHFWHADKDSIAFEEENIRSLAVSACYESALHGKLFYDDITQHMLKCAHEVGIQNFILPSYRDIIIELDIPEYSFPSSRLAYLFT